MTTWRDFATAEPAFAERALTMFTARKHMTLATLRLDGSPRISGTEIELVEGDLTLGMMAGSRKAEDLRRDPRLAIHSPTQDPPTDNPGGWSGEAKLAGRAVEGPLAEDGSHRFRVDITEVVCTGISPTNDFLIIESWHPAIGLRRVDRR